MSILKNEELNWKILFDTLLNNEKVTFNLEADEKTIKLIANSHDADIIKQRLLETLGSDEGFQKNMPYLISNKQTTQLSSNVSYIIEQPADDVPTGKDILLKLFGEEAFSEFAIDIDKLFDKTAFTKERVLYSKTTTHQKVLESWNSALKHLISFFKNVEVARIREAWVNKENPLPTPPSDINEKEESVGLVNGLIQQCFGTIKQDSNKGQIFFNFGRLWEFVSAPLIKQENLEENNVTLTIDINHLLSCLQALTQNRVLFRVYQSEQTLEEYKAKAIFFGREPTIAKPLYHTLIIDRSSSMEDYFSDLKVHLLDVIKNLRQLDDTAVLRLVFFSDTLQMKEFPISNFGEIQNYVDNTSSYGDTRLFRTIADELAYFKEQGITENYNGTILLFTDGQDNYAKMNDQKFPLIEKSLNQFGKAPLPKVFAVGFGACDTNTLLGIAKIIGNPYIQLKNINDFRDIFETLKMNRYQRDMIEFLIQVHAMNRQFTVPFYHSNTVQIPDIVIPMEKDHPMSVTVSGNKLVVTLKNDQVPVATINDKLSEILISAREVISDDKVHLSQKLSKLESLLKNIDDLHVTSSDKGIADYIKSQITSYVQQLKDNQNDTRMIASIGTLVASRRGFLPTPPVNQTHEEKLEQVTYQYN